MNTTLFVGRLSWDTKEPQLRAAFEEFGEVTNARVITDRDTGRSRGFAFVTFANGDSAERAVDEMNGVMLDGREIVVREAEDKGPRAGGAGGGDRGGRAGGGRDGGRGGDRGGRSGGGDRGGRGQGGSYSGGNTLFVGSLSWDTKEPQLRSAFEEFGDINEARVITDRDTGRSRGFAFVTFEAADAAERAVREMNGAVLDGREIVVNEAKERQPRGDRRY
ncbi:MAG: RNA-binding protein [Planctomycetota bacterium]|nr:RNA-binding protein [Planctomycetota bacterium]